MVSLSTWALTCLLAASGDAMLLEFTADWCGACKTVEPTVERLRNEGYPIRRVLVDREPQLASQFGVTAVPCFILVADGQTIDRVEGAASHARLRQMFERLSSSAASAKPQLGQAPTLVRGQSPPRGGGFGLPRPLASLAKGLSRPSPANANAAGIPPVEITTAAPSEIAQGPPVAPASFAEAPGSTSVHPVSSTPAVSPPTSYPGRTGFANAMNQPASGLAPTAAVEDAFRATVRLRVEDPTGHSLGTGTIIDRHGNEALVVTCGHIFRESGGRGTIHVDLFPGGPPKTVAGTLISLDLERDVALVSIAPEMAVVPARVAPPGFPVQRGQSVFSIGCDKGADPSVQQTTINSIDRYVGAPNLQVAGIPVDGRSGGGLFSADGYLIGVCNAADQQDREGIFASLPNIHWELDKIGQQRVYDPRANLAVAAAQPAPTPVAPSPTRPAATTMVPASSGPLPRDMPAAQLVISPPNAVETEDTEVICIVRSRNNPQGSQQLLVLDRPSREFLDRLSSESQRLAASGVAPSVAGPASRFTNPTEAARDAIIRAQSRER